MRRCDMKRVAKLRARTCLLCVLRGARLFGASDCDCFPAIYYHICLVFIEIHWKRALFINTRVRRTYDKLKISLLYSPSPHFPPSELFELLCPFKMSVWV